MTESNLAAFATTIPQLFQASQYSLDQETADFPLHRVVPITIYVDGDYGELTELANDLRDEVVRIMTEVGYPQVGEWGPFSGSYLTTIFGKGERPESGQSVLRHLRDLSAQLLHLKEKIPPAAVESVWAVMVVGNFVIHLVGPAAVAAALPVAVPIVVIEYIQLAVEAAESIEAIRNVLHLKPFHRDQRLLEPGDFTL